jgi:hypothetical protein
LKKLFFFILLAASLVSHAQEKVAFEFYLGAGITFTNSPSQNFESGIRHTDSIVSGVWYYTQQNVKNTISYESGSGMTFRAGGKMNYHFSKTFGVSLGSGIHVFSLNRTHSRSYNELSTEHLSFTAPPYFIGILIDDMPVMYLQSMKKEKFHFFTFEFPISFFVAISRWKWEGGITPALVLTTKRELEKSFDPEIEFTNHFNNKKSSMVSLYFSPSYSINKNIRVGLSYEHGLGNLVDNERTDVYKTSSIFSRSISLKLFAGLGKSGK